MDVVVDEDMVEEVEDPPHVSIVVRLVMSHESELSFTCFSHIFIVPNMYPRIF
jgi:hypothetical protein